MLIKLFPVKDTGSNITFALYGDEETYNLHFEYDANK